MGKEISDICKEIGIQDINDKFVSKTTIKKAIFDFHYKRMLEDMEGSKKQHGS